MVVMEEMTPRSRTSSRRAEEGIFISHPFITAGGGGFHRRRVSEERTSQQNKEPPPMTTTTTTESLTGGLIMGGGSGRGMRRRPPPTIAPSRSQDVENKTDLVEDVVEDLLKTHGLMEWASSSDDNQQVTSFGVSFFMDPRDFTAGRGLLPRRRLRVEELSFSPSLRTGATVSVVFLWSWSKVHILPSSDWVHLHMMQEAIGDYVLSPYGRWFTPQDPPRVKDVVLAETKGGASFRRAVVTKRWWEEGGGRCVVNVLFLDCGGRGAGIDVRGCFYVPDAIAKLPIWGLCLDLEGVEEGVEVDMSLKMRVITAFGALLQRPFRLILGEDASLVMNPRRPPLLDGISFKGTLGIRKSCSNLNRLVMETLKKLKEDKDNNNLTI